MGEETPLDPPAAQGFSCGGAEDTADLVSWRGENGRHHSPASGNRDRHWPKGGAGVGRFPTLKSNLTNSYKII